MPFPSPGDLPDPGIKLGSPALQVDSLTSEPPGKPKKHICCCSVTKLCLTLFDSMDCSTPAYLSFTISWSLLKLMSIELVMPSNHLVLCRPLLLLSSIFPSISVFSKESGHCTRWPKHWRFSFGISTSNEYSGLISFRIDWFDFLAVQGTLKSLLQHPHSKASIPQHSAFLMVQLSHLYMNPGKTIALWAK